MTKFVIHSEWIAYFRNLIDSFYDDEGNVINEENLEDAFIIAFKLFEEISNYAEIGECFFNDSECQCRAKAMFLSLKPQIDADLELLRKSDELLRKDGEV